MQVGGANWTGTAIEPVDKDRPRGSWELESAQLVAARTGLQLAMLRASRADRSEIEHAERRYRNALHLLQRIRASLNDSSNAE
jgi:hypothetical protein